MKLSEPMDYPVNWYHALTDTVEERIAWLRSATDDELTKYVEAHRSPSAHIARLVNENHDLRLENARLQERSRLHDRLLTTYRKDDPRLRALAGAAVALRRGGLASV